MESRDLPARALAPVNGIMAALTLGDSGSAYEKPKHFIPICLRWYCCFWQPY
jgi:hypothetical protein